MSQRMTNASDNNKPIIGVLDNKQIDKFTQMYDDYDYDLTTKKKIIRVISVIFIALIIFWTFYNALFVLDFSQYSAKGLSVCEINISDDNILSFHLKSNGYYLTNNYYLTTERINEGILYITVERPIILKKRSLNQMKKDLVYQKYEINVAGVSTVYYKGKDINDKFLIWKR